MRLTGPTVAKLSLPDGKSEAIVFDDALPGFGVRLRAGGKRVWIAQYRVGSKQRRVTIGSVATINADKARAAAKDILANVQLGHDPQAKKMGARAKAAATLGAIADTYLEGSAKDRLREKTLTDVSRHLRTHWKPLRGVEMHRLTRADIATQLGVIAKENGPFTANRARASLSTLFGWAMREGLVEANTVIGTNKATEEVSRDRVLSDDELADIWRASGTSAFGSIVRLLILTGQRRAEVGSMAHSEIQSDKALWTLPRERTKNGLAHDVPLSSAALELIAGIPEREDRDLVFGEGVGGFSGWGKAKTALDARIAAAVQKRSKDRGSTPKPALPWRLHDIRRTVATRLGDLGVLPHVVEAVLNHVSGHRAGVAGIYNKAVYAAEKRAALDMWSAHIAKLAGPT